ncbi:MULTISPECIES: DUF305 domain-containing protein [Rhodococcus]|uniref:DUF305 domain-containing protein n=2 Tax=Rhodococcus opacus TaxID=37919 RepID=I0WY27_RHOOP|nr:MULTISPECIES: DUF305 domain-containing protein [Rhodococcus]EID81293.1 hypothetical protein W59_03401 [Rhodococcus opacus RKJ300 = JCM 13270]KAF0957094.1 hypothetical protein MLGJGCBP_08924 [Rhodococcus sp. T7]KAF0959840.1 hypothetical protein MLGJGCBP_07079 [Rhodococcus sp. T7]QQZ19268.1 DUF305 domain-containing protein [Rhodococcus sp. 21391]UOT08042.1 DUF305 domain-containing protein [Rhodococcus opacus]
MANTSPAAAAPDPAMVDDAARRRSASRSAVALGAIIAVLVGVLLGAWAQRWLDGDQPGAPAGDSVDVGFAQDMSVHHGQAVEMSAMALANAADPAVRSLAYDVLTTQQSQLGTMQGWLSLWDRPPLGSGEPMQWMPTDSAAGSAHHSMPGMESGTATADSSSPPMPGMATTGELADLRRTTGSAFDARYLQLLLRHHKGGIPMAQYAADNAAVPPVSALAGQMVATQQAESTAIEQLLAAKGATALTMN